MAWNDPQWGNQNGGKKNSGGPPDLDELWKNFNRRLNGLFGRKGGGGEEPPPRIVSDGTEVLLDSEVAGDEPFMLARNLPGVVVLVDKNRVKAGAYAIKRFGCDTLVLDDG